MKALLIEFDGLTGVRAGNIDPRDRKLPCRGWQNLDFTPAIEIRLVEDDRDLEQYKDVEGITVLEGKDEINQAIKDNIPVKHSVSDMSLMIEHAKEKRISLDLFVGKSMNDIAKIAIEKNLAGVVEGKPKLLE